MLSTDDVAVECIEKVGTERFFKTMLSVLHLTFDLREPDYACSVWTIASILKACAALESRGIDTTGIHSMLADSSNFMIEYLRRCSPAWIYIRHCAKLFLFGLHIIFPRLVNLEAHPSRHDIQFKELTREVQAYLLSDGFEDIRETSMHVLWSLMWSPRFQQRVRKAGGIDTCCLQLKQNASGAAMGPSSSALLSPISFFLLKKIVDILSSALQPSESVAIVGGSKVAACLIAPSASNAAQDPGSNSVVSIVSAFSAPTRRPVIADAVADEDRLILSSVTSKNVKCHDNHSSSSAVEAPACPSVEDSLCEDLIRPYLNFLPSNFCHHHRIKYSCKDCKGASFCSHEKRRAECKYCGGGSICQHERVRSLCKDCMGSGICKHGRRKTLCKDCGGGSLCQHGRRRSSCKNCQVAKIAKQ